MWNHFQTRKNGLTSKEELGGANSTFNSSSLSDENPIPQWKEIPQQKTRNLRSNAVKKKRSEICFATDHVSQDRCEGLSPPPQNVMKTSKIRPPCRIGITKVRKDKKSR
ncbi:hypothetical protein NPIL_691031 [Nephila pilipes]|uniref:Uncharacterized protein n=1 Tax=Nephila pilipes TaxID=299642 RepID=A0A8X6P669_NEPPI|nr:hypothetical protein NPIL_691031 [Nephila pilipes]